MMGAKRKERYNEISLPLVGWSANSTGRSCDVQNNCNVFHTACCVRPITSAVQHQQRQSGYTTLGLAEPLNYGLSTPTGLCQSCNSSQRAGVAWANCWQTGCKAPCSLLAMQPAGDFTWTVSLSGVSQ